MTKPICVKEATSLPEFIAKAKKERCTEFSLESVCTAEEKFAKASRCVLIIKFYVACTALKNREEVAFFMQHLLSYTISALGKDAKKDVSNYYRTLRGTAKKMASEIKRSIPKAKVTKARRKTLTPS